MKDLKTGDLILFSESLWSRGMCASSVSHCVVVVCNRAGVPWALEITPEQGQPTLVPLASYDCPLYVRSISRELPLSAAVEYVRLIRNDTYSHSYMAAMLGLSIDVSSPCCSTLVAGLYLFCGAMTGDALKLLPGDFNCGHLPTTGGYSFGQLRLLSRGRQLL